MVSNKSKNKPKEYSSAKRIEDDESKFRQQVRDIVDGKILTIFMTLVTLWALFGNDVRLFIFSKNVDLFFFISFAVCFGLFAVELILFSVVTDDYKFGFFFWLDIVATVSLIPDIPWIYDPIIGLGGFSPETSNVTAETDSERAGETGRYIEKFLKSVRLIRLVRIVKLYKYVTKPSEDDEEKKRKEQKEAMNARQAALNREMEPTRLGKRLSDITTRRVIVVILLMLFLIPFL